MGFRRIAAFGLCLVFLFLAVSCQSDGEDPAAVPSEGLSFRSHYDGTCSLAGIGECTDTDILVPEYSPAGDLVTEVDGYAFQNEDAVTSVRFTSDVTAIGEYAFAGCTSLVRMQLPDKVKTVGIYAFSRCSSITWFYLGGGLGEIGDGAFSGCNAVKYAFYRGSASDWRNVRVGASNSSVTMEGVLFFYSATRPRTSGYFWYYDHGSIAFWN